MVGLFIYGYCFFYYFNHSGMSGFLQTAFYFLYMADVAFAFFLMMGAVGFYSAFAFVRYIYGCVPLWGHAGARARLRAGVCELHWVLDGYRLLSLSLSLFNTRAAAPLLCLQVHQDGLSTNTAHAGSRELRRGAARSRHGSYSRRLGRRRRQATARAWTLRPRAAAAAAASRARH